MLLTQSLGMVNKFIGNFRFAYAPGSSDRRLALGHRRLSIIDLSERGLAMAPADEALKADLAWVSGKARAARFRELGDLEDWRQANLVLRDATRAGSHSDEASLLYVLLQDMGSAGSVERQLEVARELIARAPDSEQAAQVRAYLASQGRQP